jgi:tRNA(adenine34) deaminase
MQPRQLDEQFMMQALAEADLADQQGEVPIGAVIVHGERVIGRGHNLRETLNDPTAHAEMIAITAAAEALGTWRLTGCSLYVTLEPCCMCAGAIVLARLSRLVFAAEDSKAGACGTLYKIPQDERLNHRVEVVSGVLAEQAIGRLQRFFAHQRALGKK